jgi:hypothetical protein
MVCVLSIFFVPLAHGPYSAVHGPTTALRAFRQKLHLVLSMWLAALQVPLAGLTPAATVAQASRECLFDSKAPELNAVLRC